MKISKSRLNVAPDRWPRLRAVPALGRPERPAHPLTRDKLRTVFILESVGLRRGEARILADVSADVSAGTCLAVTGPSGAGKSSLLRLLNRLADPTEGRILFEGRPLAEYDVTGLRRQVGLVAQRPVLLTSTVADELRVGAAGLSDDEAALLLERVGLEAAFAARTTGGLSGGEAQRVCLARSLAVRPRVLLLDEPTSALDEASAQALENTVAEFVRSGGTAVLVSHRLDQVLRLAGHALVLKAGQVAESGPPATLAYLGNGGGKGS